MATNADFAGTRGSIRDPSAVIRLHKATLRHQEEHPELSYADAMDAIKRNLAESSTCSTPGHSEPLASYGTSRSDFDDMTRDVSTVMRVHKATIAYLADHPELGTGTGAYVKALTALKREAGVE